MCDTNTALRKKPKPSSEPHKPSEPNPKPITPSALVCFYGHLVTSSTSKRGEQTWRRSPSTPWPNVPPGRILCQKCYETHRIAVSQGVSQHTFDHLFTKNRNQSVASPSHHSTVSQSPPAPVASVEEDVQGEMRCDICALDHIESSISHECEIGWYRLMCANFGASDTARPPG